MNFVCAHVEGIVSAGHNLRDADFLNEMAQSLWRINEAIEINLLQILAGLAFDLCSLGPYAIGVIRASDIRWKIPSTVGRADFHAGITVQNAAKNQARERDRGLKGLADGISQVALINSISDRRAERMQEDEAAELLGLRPKSANTRVIQLGPIDRRRYFDPTQTIFANAVCELLDRKLSMLKRHISKTGDAIRVLRTH